MKKQYFHSLDALRFFAFLKVYLLHIPIQGEFPIFSYLKKGGGLGVAFFFVLSGFLITYLLVFEKIKYHQINIKKFLIRRSLRIWPLFYLLVILGFFLPYDFKEFIGMHMVGGGYELDWRFSFSFLENYKMLITDNFPKTTPLSVFWSLCIEEHFYLVWMVSLFFIPVKRFPFFLVSCVGVALVARWIEPSIWHNSTIETNDLFTNLDYFAFGGLLGYFVAMDIKYVETFIEGIPVWIRYFALTIVILVVVFHPEIFPANASRHFLLFKPTIFAILFTLTIAVFIPINSSIKIKSKILTYLGTISYGLYVYHIIFIHILFQYFLRNDIKIDNWGTLSLFMLLTMGSSIFVSSLSFRYFEKIFLLWRERLTRV